MPFLLLVDAEGGGAMTGAGGVGAATFCRFCRREEDAGWAGAGGVLGSWALRFRDDVGAAGPEDGAGAAGAAGGAGVDGPAWFAAWRAEDRVILEDMSKGFWFGRERGKGSRREVKSRMGERINEAARTLDSSGRGPPGRRSVV